MTFYAKEAYMTDAEKRLVDVIVDNRLREILASLNEPEAAAFQSRFLANRDEGQPVADAFEKRLGSDIETVREEWAAGWILQQ